MEEQHMTVIEGRRTKAADWLRITPWLAEALPERSVTDALNPQNKFPECRISRPWSAIGEAEPSGAYVVSVLNDSLSLWYEDGTRHRNWMTARQGHGHELALDLARMVVISDSNAGAQPPGRAERTNTRPRFATDLMLQSPGSSGQHPNDLRSRPWSR